MYLKGDAKDNCVLHLVANEKIVKCSKIFCIGVDLKRDVRWKPNTAILRKRKSKS